MQRGLILKMPKCSICGKMYEINSGLSLILLTGDIMHFCSSKCRKNYDLGRDKKKLKWARQSTNLIEEEEENNKK